MNLGGSVVRHFHRFGWRGGWEGRRGAEVCDVNVNPGKSRFAQSHIALVRATLLRVCSDTPGPCTQSAVSPRHIALPGFSPDSIVFDRLFIGRVVPRNMSNTRCHYHMGIRSLTSKPR